MEPEQAFYCRDGKVAHTLEELSAILQDMSPDEFSHHANEFKNDFASWIEHVINDAELSGKVKKTASREEILLAINERIMRLEVSDRLKDMKAKVEEFTILPSQPQEARQQAPEQQPTLFPKHRESTEEHLKEGISRQEDAREHPYRYFTLREFAMGVLLGFVLGFVLSKLIFGTLLE